jgi:hypothetical protein
MCWSLCGSMNCKGSLKHLNSNIVHIRTWRIVQSIDKANTTSRKTTKGWWWRQSQWNIYGFGMHLYCFQVLKIISMWLIVLFFMVNYLHDVPHMQNPLLMTMPIACVISYLIIMSQLDHLPNNYLWGIRWKKKMVHKNSWKGSTCQISSLKPN